MRMWMLPPVMLCKSHLLGEHAEIHKHKHNFVNQHSITGRLKPHVQIEPASMQSRHDELAEEMKHRGYNHNSPYILPDLSYLPDEERNAKADLQYNINDLMERCSECERMINHV